MSWKRAEDRRKQEGWGGVCQDSRCREGGVHRTMETVSYWGDSAEEPLFPLCVRVRACLSICKYSAVRAANTVPGTLL